MKYTILLQKVIKEVIGLVTIVLFIYTCTKVRTTVGRKKGAAIDTIHTGTSVGFGWPVQIAGYDPCYRTMTFRSNLMIKEHSTPSEEVQQAGTSLPVRIRLIWVPAIR
jgi:hypothetical protein